MSQKPCGDVENQLLEDGRDDFQYGGAWVMASSKGNVKILPFPKS